MILYIHIKIKCLWVREMFSGNCSTFVAVFVLGLSRIPQWYILWAVPLCYFPFLLVFTPQKPNIWQRPHILGVVGLSPAASLHLCSLRILLMFSSPPNDSGCACVVLPLVALFLCISEPVL